MTISGGYPTPNTFAADGTPYKIAMVAGDNFTLYFTNSGTTRDGFIVLNVFSANSSQYYASSTAISITAYEQVQNTFSVTFNGGSPTSSDSLKLTGTYLGTSSATIATLTSTNNWSNSTWSDYNTAVTFPATTSLSNSTIQWILNGGAYTTSALTAGGNTYPKLYYHQYLITFQYSVSGGGSPTAPAVTYTQFGISGNTVNATTTGGSGVWVDAASTYTYTNPLLGSGSSERWDTSSATGTASATGTIIEPYYNQFSVTFGYGDQDSSTITSGSQIGSYYQFGASIAINAGSSYGVTSPASAWVDAGSNMVSYQTFTSGSQRWALSSSPATFTVSSSTTISDTNFYHQYNVPFAYTTNDGSTIKSQTNLVAYTQFGNVLHLSTNSAGTLSLSSDWADAGTSITYVSPISISGTERYIIASSDSGIHTVISSVASGANANPTYYHQFTVTFGYGDQDSSTITSGSQIGSYYQFGASIAINAGSSYGVTSPASAWVDAGSNMVSYQTFTSGSQRWALSSSPATFTVSSSTTISDTNFYHQYTVTFGYGDQDSSTITSGSQIGSYYQFGASIAINAGSSYGVTSPASAWVDAGSGKVTYQTFTSGSQRWALSSSPATFTVSSSTTISDTNFYHQYNVPFAYTTNDGSTIKSQTNLVAYTQFGNVLHLSTNSAGTLSLSSDWADAGTSITYVSPISISGTERYIIASSDSGIHTVISSVASGANANPTYYHQFTVTFGYGDQDSSTITSGSQIGSYYQFGASIAINAGSSYGVTSPASAWVDAGSNMVSYQTFTSGSQRWALSSSPATFTVSSSTTISDTNFYHQYTVTFGYGDQDSSTITSGSQIGSYYQFGASIAINAGSSYGVTSPASAWVDAGSGKVTYQTFTSGSQRWALSSSPATFTVSSSTTISDTNFYHQYNVPFAYTTNDGSTIKSQTNLVAYTQFGNVLHLSTNSAGALSLSSDWADASTSVSYVSPIAISGSERYMIASGDSGTHTVISSVASGASADPEYYHQYQLTVTATTGYTGGTFRITYTEFGTTYTNQQETTTWSSWADAGTTATASSAQSRVNGVYFTGYTPSSGSVTMNQAQTITLNY